MPFKRSKELSMAMAGLRGHTQPRWLGYPHPPTLARLRKASCSDFLTEPPQLGNDPDIAMSSQTTHSHVRWLGHLCTETGKQSHKAFANKNLKIWFIRHLKVPITLESPKGKTIYPCSPSNIIMKESLNTSCRVAITTKRANVLFRIIRYFILYGIMRIIKP